MSITTAHAQLTFADFVQVTGEDRNFSFTNNGTSGTLDAVGGGNPILFRYVGINPQLPVALRNFQNATLNISNAVTPVTGTTNAGNTIQPINNLIIITITRDEPFNGGSVLLRIEIASTTLGLPPSNPYLAQPPSSTAPDLFGTTNGFAPTFSGSTPGQSIRFSSDFVDFTQTNTRSLQIGLTGLDAPFALNANGFANTFTGTGTGSFSSDPRPFYNPPTSALVSIGGRVLNTSGRGIRGARVNLTDGAGVTRTAITNSFGYYNFEEVTAGQTVIVAVTAKRYLFNSQVVSVSEELTGLNFTALE